MLRGVTIEYEVDGTGAAHTLLLLLIYRLALRYSWDAHRKMFLNHLTYLELIVDIR